MTSVIEADGVRIESSEETTDQMLASVKPPKDEPTKFKAVITDGEKPEKEKTGISKAASDLGKRGGKAAAQARAAKEEEEAPEKEEPEPKAKPAAETPDEGEDDDEDEGDEPSRKSRAAERVKQATREAAEAKRDAARLRQENEELRKARTTPVEPAVRPEPVKAAEKPSWESGEFKDWDQFMDARDKWNRSEWTREQAKEQAQRAEREQVIGTVRTFQEAIADTLAEDPEFWDRVPEIHDTTPLGQLIVRAGRPPESCPTLESIPRNMRSCPDSPTPTNS